MSGGTCASNVLGVNIVIAVAFQEDFIIIKSLERSKHEPLYLFYFSETDFTPAHYQSIKPGFRPMLPHSLTHSLTHSPTPWLPPAINLTEESLHGIPVMMDCPDPVSQLQISEEPFNSVHIFTGENPVSVIDAQAPPPTRGRSDLISI